MPVARRQGFMLDLSIFVPCYGNLENPARLLASLAERPSTAVRFAVVSDAISKMGRWITG
jgi:hypothetical protein